MDRGETNCPGIYLIFNLKTRKKYVGQSKNIKKRIDQHFPTRFCGTPRLQTAIDKAIWESSYGEWDWKILERLDPEDIDLKQHLLERERYWIDYYNSIEEGYNKI